MFEDVVPKKIIGYLFPRHQVDTLAYELYHLLPDRVLLVICPVRLGRFAREDVERALAPLDEYIRRMMNRKVNIIVHGGVPLTLIQGMEAHDEMLAKINKATGLPATSTTLEVVEAVKHLGIRKVVQVNKWREDMNQSLRRYFEREGIQVAGVNCLNMGMGEAHKLSYAEHTTMLYELVRKGFKDNPDADGVYLGGGSMVSYPIVAPLEKEFGKPVVTNAAALSWGLCRKLDCWEPLKGYGRLLESA